jgi:MFS family permease
LFDWTPAVGVFLFAFGCLLFAVAATVTSPMQAASPSIPAAPTSARTPILRRKDARSPLAVMTTGQVVMVLVMTATPLQMHMHGDSLSAVGAALSAHILGMFAFSPLTGRCADRFGPRPVMWAGLAVLAGSAVLSAAPDGIVLMTALFGVGLGWNLCFVGGSSALVSSSRDADRHQVEGDVDAAIWGAAAVATLASTSLLASVGTSGLALLGGALVLPAAAVLKGSTVRGRRR